jgi:hypothetical protein
VTAGTRSPHRPRALRSLTDSGSVDLTKSDNSFTRIKLTDAGGNRVQRDDVKEGQTRSRILFKAFRGRHLHDADELGIVYQEPRNDHGINDIYEAPNGPLNNKLPHDTMTVAISVLAAQSFLDSYLDTQIRLLR